MKPKSITKLALTSRGKALARGRAVWECGEPSTNLVGAALQGWKDAARNYEQHRLAKIEQFDSKRTQQ